MISPIQFEAIDFASAAIKKSIEKKYSDVRVIITHAPSLDFSKSDYKNKAEYIKYIALTQRVTKLGKFVCYITYRTKLFKVTPSNPFGPEFSSIEIFLADYNTASSIKFKLDEHVDAEHACREALKHICELIETTK